MIRTYLEFRPKEGRAGALLDKFREHRILEISARHPGCRSAEFTVSEDGRRVIVTAAWDDQEAYDRWVGRSDRGELAEELNPLLAEPISAATRGGVFRVAHRTGGGQATTTGDDR